MNKLLGSVKNLQFIVHLYLMNVVIPANAQVFNSVIFGWVTFDLFDTEALTSLYYSPTEPEVEYQLEQLGYGSAFCLINLGSCLYIIFAQIVIVPLYALFLACFRLNCWHARSDKVSRRADRCRRWFEKQLSEVFCNTILTTLDGSLLVFMYVGVINLKSNSEGLVD